MPDQPDLDARLDAATLEIRALTEKVAWISKEMRATEDAVAELLRRLQDQPRSADSPARRPLDDRQSA